MTAKNTQSYLTAIESALADLRQVSESKKFSEGLFSKAVRNVAIACLEKPTLALNAFKKGLANDDIGKKAWRKTNLVFENVLGWQIASAKKKDGNKTVTIYTVITDGGITNKGTIESKLGGKFNAYRYTVERTQDEKIDAALAFSIEDEMVKAYKRLAKLLSEGVSEEQHDAIENKMSGIISTGKSLGYDIIALVDAK